MSEDNLSTYRLWGDAKGCTATNTNRAELMAALEAAAEAEANGVDLPPR